MSPRPRLEPRYPPTGHWPAQMRADMATAYLDYRDTREFCRAVARGEVPQPSSFHGTGRAREPVWDKLSLDRHAGARAASLPQKDGKEALRALV